MVKKSILLLALTANVNAMAAPSDQQWQGFIEASIEQHIIPGYDQLSGRAATLAQRAEQYCQAPAPQTLSQAQDAFKQTMQAWQRVSHIQFGPVTLLMRNFSMQYWPDKKNLGGRQLKSTLQGEMQNYDDAFFAAASVAIKGLPAIEKMLFPQGVSESLQGRENFCPLLTAVANHVASNSRAIAAEWRTDAVNFAEFGEDLTYETVKEAATEILKGLVEPVEAISDAKLKAPLGSELAKMRWRKSESWRSAQSIDNIRSNVNTLHHLYSGLSSHSVSELLVASDSQALAADIEAKFNQLAQLLQSLEAPVNMQYSAQQYQALKQVEDKLKRLSDALLAAMKPLDIQLGFNRRDGD